MAAPEKAVVLEERSWLDPLKNLGIALTTWTERWVPDAWIVALILSLIVFVATLIWGKVSPYGAILAWGKGFWTLLTLMAQFSLALMVAYSVSVSAPVSRGFNWLSKLANPEKPWQAILIMACFSFITGWINWAVTIVVSAMLVPYVAKNNPKVDYRLLVASAYLGIGTIWHAGISGSATLIVATPDNFLIKAGILKDVVPTSATIFSTYNIVLSLVVAIVCTFVVVAMTPPAKKAYRITPEQAEALITCKTPETSKGKLTPAEWMNNWPGFNIIFGSAGLIFLANWFSTRGMGSWTIDVYNMVFLTLAIILHWRPVSFLNSCQEGVKGAWGVLLQFPFYAGIFGLITYTAVGQELASVFSNLATRETYAAIVFWYSGIINYFIPSGGAKWAIEAPYLLEAGRQLGLSGATVTLAYAWGDMMTDVIQPFWAIALLAVVRLKFGQIMGYLTVVWLVYLVITTIGMFLMPYNL